MIKIKQKQLDKLARRKITNSELKRRYYKFKKIVSFSLRNQLFYIRSVKKLRELPIIRYNNACYLTNRGRGVLRKFKLSRHQIRDKFKFLHGLVNSSW